MQLLQVKPGTRQRSQGSCRKKCCMVSHIVLGVQVHMSFLCLILFEAVEYKHRISLQKSPNATSNVFCLTRINTTAWVHLNPQIRVPDNLEGYQQHLANWGGLGAVGEDTLQDPWGAKVTSWGPLSRQFSRGVRSGPLLMKFACNVHAGQMSSPQFMFECLLGQPARISNNSTRSVIMDRDVWGMAIQMCCAARSTQNKKDIWQCGMRC